MQGGSRGRKREARGAAESKKEKGRKKEKAEKGEEEEEEIVHLSSCKVGKMDGTRNFPSRAQPTVSDDKAGSATLQRDVLCCDLTARFSRAFGCAIILHPARINQR